MNLTYKKDDKYVQTHQIKKEIDKIIDEANKKIEAEYNSRYENGEFTLADKKRWIQIRRRKPITSRTIIRHLKKLYGEEQIIKKEGEDRYCISEFADEYIRRQAEAFGRVQLQNAMMFHSPWGVKF